MRSDADDRDLSTRARIRRKAIEVFGEKGMSTGLRAVAVAAGVSPGLVIHHFGSKENLLAECDAEVLETIRSIKSESMRHPSAAGLLASLAEIESFAPLLAYLVRSFSAGGALASSLFEQMVSNAERYLQEGVDAGTLRPSRDPKARARYLATTGAGGLLFFLQTHTAGGTEPGDYAQALRTYVDEMLLPSVEIYTEGLLTDSMMLDTLLERDRS